MDLAALVARHLAIADGPFADLALGVISGEERYVGGLGEADETSIFRIASVSKVLTALTLANSVRRGDVLLDDEAQKFVPQYPLPSWEDEPMRLWHLASHSAGLDSTTFIEDGDSYERYFEGFADIALVTRPGEHWAYSNLGASLLANVLALKMSSDFGSLFRDRIGGPLGLDDTVLTLNDEQASRLLGGHDAALNPIATPTRPVYAGSGGFYSTVNDLMRLVSAHLTVSPGLGYALVQVPQLARPGDGAMGLGWMMDPLPGTKHRMTWHNGTLPGYRSFVGFVPDTYQAVAILTNTERSVDDLAHAILADLVNQA